MSADPGITEEIIGRWFATGGGVLDVTPDDGASARLEELFPPPGPNGVKPAPEAYAW
ncbi:hypothetical protein [Actinomadura sp. 6K520]|uniref:hypothetical protein n=1 Tax=Actinomadura sp. 6K520 TaxID=2530364 RepID=UPI0014046AD9|nr:hypothetical protein [Actinomadura sp. 6K520]